MEGENDGNDGTSHSDSSDDNKDKSGNETGPGCEQVTFAMCEELAVVEVELQADKVKVYSPAFDQNPKVGFHLPSPHHGHCVHAMEWLAFSYSITIILVSKFKKITHLSKNI